MLGTDVNLTALMSAAINGYAGCIRIMIKGGADVNAKTPNGKTALVYATLFGSVNLHKNLTESRS